MLVGRFAASDHHLSICVFDGDFTAAARDVHLGGHLYETRPAPRRFVNGIDSHHDNGKTVWVLFLSITFTSLSSSSQYWRRLLISLLCSSFLLGWTDNLHNAFYDISKRAGALIPSSTLIGTRYMGAGILRTTGRGRYTRDTRHRSMWWRQQSHAMRQRDAVGLLLQLRFNLPGSQYKRFRHRGYMLSSRPRLYPHQSSLMRYRRSELDRHAIPF